MALLWIVLFVPVLIVRLAFLRFRQERRSQIRFIRTRLATVEKSSDLRRVVASLSTLPDRIGNLGPTIRCLLAQTRAPDEIVVAVPDVSARQQKAYAIPEYLATFPRVRVLRCAKDWGPATKFIPIIQEELAAGRDGTLIMVVDDDRTYPRDALETYLSYNRELPDAVLCFRGGTIIRKSGHYGLRISRGSLMRMPKSIAAITGCGSYLIQPRFFDSTLWDYSGAPPGAFYMDDIWISGWLERHGVEKFIVPTSAMMRTARDQFGTMTLGDVPSGRKRTNHELIKYFQTKYGIFRVPELC
ncbi:MAG: glycosyltransferase [Verrucomicrobiota bacterium]